MPADQVVTAMTPRPVRRGSNSGRGNAAAPAATATPSGEENGALRVTFRGDDLGLFLPQRITMSEAIQLKARTGLRVGPMLEGVAEMDGEATRALIWLLLIRNGHALAPESLDFTFEDVEVTREEDPTQANSDSVANAM